MMGKEGSFFDIGTDIGADLVGNFIPGAGIAMAGGKFFKGRHDQKKQAIQAKRMQTAYAQTKKKRR